MAFLQNKIFSPYLTRPREPKTRKTIITKASFFILYKILKAAYTQVPRPMFKYYNSFNQCCGSGTAPLRIHFGRLDPDPHRSALEYGFGSRRATKWPTKKVKKFFLKCWCFLLREEDFSCSLDVLYGSLAISKLQFILSKKKNLYCSCKFFPIFWLSAMTKKILDPDPQHCT